MSDPVDGFYIAAPNSPDYGRNQPAMFCNEQAATHWLAAHDGGKIYTVTTFDSPTKEVAANPPK